jgi:hypothetical protein
MLLAAGVWVSSPYSGEMEGCSEESTCQIVNGADDEMIDGCV